MLWKFRDALSNIVLMSISVATKNTCIQTNLKTKVSFGLRIQWDPVCDGGENLAADREGTATGAGSWLITLHPLLGNQGKNRK